MAFSRDSWRRGPRNSPPGLPGSAFPRGSLAPPGGELLGGSAETLPAPPRDTRAHARSPAPRYLRGSRLGGW